ncbi:MAG: hypothetical protein JHC28_01465 [Thermoprotei archaeon]|nr:hypothetical protein [Thermoprotei archaeon]
MLMKEKFKPGEWTKIFSWIRELLPLNFAIDDLPLKIFSGNINYSTRLFERAYDLIEGKGVAVIAAGPELAELRDLHADSLVVADAAFKYVTYELDLSPDLLITDLDGIEGIEANLLREIPLLIVHLHGDNVERARIFIGEASSHGIKALFTTQQPPSFPFFNFGGFTDGDRAVFTSLFFGAREVSVYGVGESQLMHHRSPPSEIKARKYWIGSMLVKWLACRDKRVKIPLAKGYDCSWFPWEA